MIPNSHLAQLVEAEKMELALGVFPKGTWWRILNSSNIYIILPTSYQHIFADHREPCHKRLRTYGENHAIEINDVTVEHEPNPCRRW